MKEATALEPGGLQPVADQVLEGELVLARDDSYRIRPHRSRRAPLVWRDGVFPARDGRPPARRAHPAARRRPADHAARGSGHRGARRRRLRHFPRSSWCMPWPGAIRRSCRSRAARASTLAQGGDAHAGGRGSRRAARRRDHLLRARPRRRSRQAADRNAAATCFSSRCGRSRKSSSLAQSQAMSGMASEQIETLIAAQKEIINATWNIERRAASGAGRSAVDITAIATAQAELEDARRGDCLAHGTGPRRDALSAAACRRGAQAGRGGQAVRPIRWALRSPR